MLKAFFISLLPTAIAALNLSTPRGEQVISIPSAYSSRPEICVIPKKYPNASYSPKDLQREQELCSLQGVEPVALCPKMVSTNPAIEFFSVPEGFTAAQVEARMCTQEDAKKLAKYKSSISCSYTPSLLAYYHISRILGDIGQVPPVVLRTMNLKHHRALAEKAVAKVDPRNALLKKIWRGYAKHLAAGPASPKRDDLLTSDFTQTYGALQFNPRDEEKYSEMFFSARGSETRADAFRSRSPIYALLKDSRPLRSLVGNQWSAGNVQRLVQMQNVADMIVLDHLLNQQDRFGNIHFTKAYYFVGATEGVPQVLFTRTMEMEEVRSVGAVQVKQMMLKDNDCGVTKDNLAKKAGLLRGLSHLNPETYARLLKLRSDLSQESTRRFFKTETLMTEADYASLKANMEEVVRTLQNSCRAGRLKLDLNLDAHFINKPLHQECG